MFGEQTDDEFDGYETEVEDAAASEYSKHEALEPAYMTKAKSDWRRFDDFTTTGELPFLLPRKALG